MEWSAELPATAQELNSVLGSLDLSILEFNELYVQNNFKNIIVVLYHKNGLSLELCTEAHKLLQARLENIYGDRDFSLEVSSPGLGRRIKARHELEHFIDQDLRVLLSSTATWCLGSLVKADANKIIIRNNAMLEEAIEFNDIKKIELNNIEE